MTLQACRHPLLNVPREQGAHPGLLLSRFLRIPVQDEEKKHPDERLNLFRAMQAAQKNKELQAIYSLAFQRRQHSLGEAVQAYLAVQGRLIVGLGGENILETGITLHHTYGVPIIPGAALKGLAAHYCDQVWGAKQPEFKRSEDGEEKKPLGRYYRLLFGTTEDSGHIIFHEAWMTPESLTAPNQGLILDVMTPHHSEYYMAKDETAPTDYDSPNPVTFLSVAGTFHVAVSCDAPEETGKKWALFASTLLTQALAHWGVGGKTNAGYGRMIDLSQAVTHLSSPNDGDPAISISSGPRFKAGERVIVKRVEDPRGKGRTWFQAEDGLSGRVTHGAEPQVQIGETVSLWIASASKDSYNFSTEAPQAPRNIPGRGRRAR